MFGWGGGRTALALLAKYGRIAVYARHQLAWLGASMSSPCSLRNVFDLLFDAMYTKATILFSCECSLIILFGSLVTPFDSVWTSSLVTGSS